MVPRRYRVLFWAGPFIALGWLMVALVNPEPRSRALEYFEVGLFLGTMFGQTTLAAAWMALGPAPLVWRLPLSLIWIGMLTAALGLNLGFHGGGPAEIAVVVGCCLLGQWFLVQLPLWGLAMGYGLRLRHIDDTHRVADRREKQFGIRQLMIVTAIVGVIFGVGRLVVTIAGVRFSADSAGPGAAIVIFLAVAAIVITLPLLLAALLPRLSVPAVLLVLVLIGAATVWELPLLRGIGSGGGPDTSHFVWINAFTALWILAVVAVVRLNGYCLSTPGLRPVLDAKT